jgi:hypothetical protein
LISTINWPVLVRTAVCSIAHSSGAPRLALLHRAIQPGGVGVFAGTASVAVAPAAGVACATGGGFLALGACARLGTQKENIAIDATNSFVEIFKGPAPNEPPSDVPVTVRSQVIRRLA